MAGETPGADRSRQKRRAVAWKDDRSTNKIYASGNVSALGAQSAADSKLKAGEQPKGTAYQPPKADDRSADKYYRDRTQAATKEQAARGQLGSVPQLGIKRSVHGKTPKQAVQDKKKRAANPAADLTILEPHEVNGVMTEVVNRLENGQTNIVIYIKQGDSNLLRRARTSLDLLVTREVITEDQHRDCRLSYTMSDTEKADVNKKLGEVPTPKVTKNLDEDADIDIDTFLANGEEETVDTAAVETVEVDASADVQDSPAPSYPTAGDEDDDMGDLLTPKMEPLESTVFDEPWKTEGGDPEKIGAAKPEAITIPGFQKLPSSHIGVPPPEASPRPPVSSTVEMMEGIGDTTEATPPTSSIEIPQNSMDGIGDKPKPTTRRLGRRTGRGSV